mgnify:CR=1 FL=1
MKLWVKWDSITYNGACDLVAKGAVGAEMRGSVYIGLGQYSPDRAGDAPLTSSALRARAMTAGQEVTFTCAPPDSSRSTDFGSYTPADQARSGSENSVAPLCA